MATQYLMDRLAIEPHCLAAGAYTNVTIFVQMAQRIIWRWKR